MDRGSHMPEYPRDAILREQVRLAMRQLPTMQAASFLVAVALSFVVEDITSRSNILLWVLSVLAIALTRTALYYRFLKVRDQLFEGHYWKNACLIMAFASGLIWGCSAFIILPAGNPGLMSLFVLAMVGMAAATTISHSSLRFGPMAWVVPALLPYVFRCIMEGGQSGYTIALLIAIYLFAIIRFSFNHNNVTSSAIALKFENQGLLEDLQKANESLRQDIVERRKAELLLKESEELFRNLAESCPFAIMIYQGDYWVYANPSAERISGYSREELYRLYYWDFVAPEFAAMIKQRGNTRQNGETVPATYDFKIAAKGGVPKWVSVTGAAIQYRGRPAGLVSVQDITERKLAEEALQKSERRLLRAEEVAKLGYWEFFLERNVVHASDGARTIYGVMDKELSIPYAQRIPLQEYRPMLDLALTELVQRGKPYNLEFKVRRPSDGRVVDIHSIAEYEASAKVVFGVIQDVTEWKHAEDELKRTTELLRSFIRACPLAINMLDFEGRVVLWNPAAEAMFGWQEEEVIGYPLPTWPGDVAAESHSIMQRVLNGELLTEIETNRKRKDGTVIDVLITAAPVRGSAGRIVGALGILTDITEKRKAAHEKELLRNQLYQAQKMEAVGQLAGGIAHDFNNILTAIVGNAYLASRQMDSDDPRKTLIDRIGTSAERAANLTQSLLAFSRKQLLEKKPSDVNEIIEHVHGFLDRLIGEDVELKISLSASPLIAIVDSMQMEQVLMNLVTNARDAMPEGGKLVIGTSIVLWTDEFVKQQGFGLKGDYVCITVRDTGTGMDEVTRQKAFEPFFTTKELGRGTGLGLAMVYGIVKQHDGYVNVQSKVDEGTSFEIFLPMSHALTPEKRAAIVGDNVTGGTETILIAEDDVEIRQTTRTLLESHGYHVVEAVDGEDALKKYLELSGTIDLIVLDVIMPKKNGRQVYEEITRSGRGVKALFVSGYPAGTIGSKGILEEGVHFMRKPASPKEFLRRVRTILDSSGHRA